MRPIWLDVRLTLWLCTTCRRIEQKRLPAGGCRQGAADRVRRRRRSGSGRSGSGRSAESCRSAESATACYPPPSALGSWCSGLTCQPVTLEIAGSNPVEPAIALDSSSPVPARTGLFLVRWLRPGRFSLGDAIEIRAGRAPEGFRIGARPRSSSLRTVTARSLRMRSRQPGQNGRESCAKPLALTHNQTLQGAGLAGAARSGGTIG